jgi:hypothetical protein
MPSIINSSTTSGLIATGSTDGSLALQTANTTALTVTSAQLVGMGTTSPSTVLDVASSNSGMTLTNTAVSNKKWRLGGNSSGYFQITETGVADRLTIDTSGNLNISTSNAGIIFNNSSALTNSTFNDYETGTWTPTATSQLGSITSYTSSGNYTKIGRIVYVTGIITITNGGTASGVLYVGAYPFASGSSVAAQSGLAIEVNITGYSYNVRISSSSSGGFIGSLTTTAVIYTNTASYQFSLTYFT